ncbi:maleylpyruvate isomerase family mycothiol-dependent enzyme [Yinghuangia sp. YIM S09857]|uniref:maleylpyruvate isomerase family mycothiol-dependent enzyme n=1 Tax=Yinghuangia sp. YIM S09857 TaxID=3436929 RepID=UPI003F52F65E
MSGVPDEALRWARIGTGQLLGACAAFDESAYGAPTPLPGWTRRHLAAHIAANADALRNLVHWAATGEPTPMYATPEERRAGIERGTTMTAPALNDWLTRSAATLDTDLSALTAAQWDHEVVTAQGRVVPASEIPWLRAREVCVHAVDLDAGIEFADLPADFLTRLAAEAAAKHDGAPVPVLTLTATDRNHTWTVNLDRSPTHISISQPLPTICAYLTGRATAVPTDAGAPAPELPAWL